jgi:hypothetical protein
VFGDQAFDRGSEVLPEMETVSNLNRVRRSGPGAVGIRAGPVPADHLGRFVLQEPVSQRLRIASLYQIEDAVVLAVDQDGAVMVSSFDGEVVDVEHPHRAHLGVWNCSDQVQ